MSLLQFSIMVHNEVVGCSSLVYHCLVEAGYLLVVPQQKEESVKTWM